MADVLVTYEMLEGSATKLHHVKDFIDKLEDRVDGAADDWGHHDVADAMHTFGTNWGYHREKLSDLIGSVAEKFEKSAERWRDVDRDEAKTAHGIVKEKK